MRLSMVIVLLCLLVAGCSYQHSAVVIPTGNPVSDIMVTSLVWEGAHLLAHDFAETLLADSECARPCNEHLEYSRRAPGLVYAGKWR